MALFFSIIHTFLPKGEIFYFEQFSFMLLPLNRKTLNINASMMVIIGKGIVREKNVNLREIAL